MTAAFSSFAIVQSDVATAVAEWSLHKENFVMPRSLTPLMLHNAAKSEGTLPTPSLA